MATPYQEGVHDGLEQASKLCAAAADGRLDMAVRTAMLAMAATIRALAKESVK